MKKLVFVGNCQGRRLQVLYEEKFSSVTGDTTEFIGSFDQLTPRVRQILVEADVIVAQALDTEHEIAIGKFETNAQIIEFPNVAGVFLWPFSGESHVRNQPLHDLQDGPYGQQFGDRWLNKCIKAGTKPEDICAEYEALDVAKVVNLDRMYELIMHYMRRADVRTGFEFAPLIAKFVSEEPLFLTPSNLQLRLFRPLAQGVYQRLGIPPETVASVLDALWRSPFPLVEHPIHPSVARHFGLKFARTDTRYRTLSGETITFREWVARYVGYEWNEPLLEATRQIHTVRSFDARAEQLLHKIEVLTAGTDGSIIGESCCAHLLFLKGDLPAAAAAARRALMLAPSNPQHFATLMFHLSDLGEHEEAERLAKMVVTQWPHYPDGWRNLGLVLSRQGKPAEAVEPLRQAVGLNPRDVEAANLLANVLADAGHSDRALSILAVATVLNPEAADLYDNLALKLTELGDFDSALVTIRRAIALDPHQIGRREHLVNILAARGDLVGACVAMREAITLDPKRSDLHLSLAALLTQLGRGEEALAESRLAMQLEMANVPPAEPGFESAPPQSLAVELQ